MVKQMVFPDLLVLLGPMCHGRRERVVNVPDVPVENTCPRKFTCGIREGIILKVGETRKLLKTLKQV